MITTMSTRIPRAYTDGSGKQIATRHNHHLMEKKKYYNCGNYHPMEKKLFVVIMVKRGILLIIAS